MFSRCSQLSDISGLKNWNVSNGTNFSYLFEDCLSLSDISSLKNWNVSNGKDFYNIFYFCRSINKQTIPNNLKKYFN